MPGDRLMVYRDPIVRATIFIDRIAAPFQTAINGVLQYSIAIRAAKLINAPLNFTGTGAGTGAPGTPPPAQPGAR
jgi:polysaccharide export outer membrane protein